MATILINGNDRVINVYLETRIDPNGSFVLPYQYEPSDKIAQIEATITNNEVSRLVEQGQTNITDISNILAFGDTQTSVLAELGEISAIDTPSILISSDNQTSVANEPGQISVIDISNTLTFGDSQITPVLGELGQTDIIDISNTITFGDSQTSVASEPGQINIIDNFNVSTLDDIKAHFLPSPEKYFIEGITDSKFSLLDLSYPKNVALKQYQQVNEKQVLLRNATGTIIATPPPANIRVGKRIEISGTNVVGMILLESDTRIEYVLYLDTPNPIFYVDNVTGNTIFKYMRNNSNETVRPGLNYYSDMVDEPKILSEVFIDRGTNNAFEPMRKLKNIKGLNELVKTGFGYYKINTRGYNFKDQ
jgi:hypothetical protein